jgi:hypothetical protein
MGTNFYRIPTEDEMAQRKKILIDRINDMELSPKNIESDFHYVKTKFEYIYDSPWDEFLDEMKIHLGKGSSGWKFVWNFHDNKYYSSKEELLKFIRSGRVIDEYGDLVPNEEFITEALEWGQPDGHVYNKEYLEKHPTMFSHIDMSEHYSKIIDGLVVSANTEFC